MITVEVHNITQVYKKPNDIQNLKTILDKERPSSILLIRGNSSYEACGAKVLLEPQLAGYNVTHLSGFYKSPSAEDIERTIQIIKDKNIDFIIGIGGGTVMDIAKAASILSSEPKAVKEYVSGKIKPKGNNIKRLLIPTTAGTGAEITPFSVVYIDKKKYSLAHPNMSPDYVILMAELTTSLSPKVTAETGMDALAQGIEAYWSVNATPKSKDYSKEAIKLVITNLSKAVNNPDLKVRKNMLLGAHLAGKAISIAKTTAAHALSYPLTAYHNVPHGHAVMLTLPYFFPINENATEQNIQEKIDLNYAKKTFEELLKIMNVSNSTEAKDKLLSLMDEVSLPRKLTELGIKEENLQNIINNGFNPQRVKNNPVVITEEIEWDILREIL